jgi:hypothetical protein
MIADPTVIEVPDPAGAASTMFCSSAARRSTRS